MEKWNELEWWKRTVRELFDNIQEEIIVKRSRFDEIEKEDLPYYKKMLEELEEKEDFKITKVRNIAIYLQGVYNEIAGDDDNE